MLDLVRKSKDVNVKISQGINLIGKKKQSLGRPKNTLQAESIGNIKEIYYEYMDMQKMGKILF